MVIGTNNGRFEFRSGPCKGKSFAPTREGLRELARALESMGSPESVGCSSDCDYPEDGTFPEGYDPRDFIGVALALALEGLIDEIDSEDVAPHVARVVVELS